ncbi:MAG: hypothetical protein IKQ69_02900 [Oscillospiraceae bacterium]|nr:hypothetical protein [Oscillospiraceae bacterium]
MKLGVSGTPAGPDVLLLSGERLSPEELCAAMPGLAGKYRLLTARSGSPEELYEALRSDGTIRLWGAYGLEEGAGSLLAFLGSGRMEVRTAVTEGPFDLPPASLRDFGGELICWKGGKDKKAGKAVEALREDRPSLRTLTLDKLKAGETYFSRRPDRMEQRLIATFGEAAALRMRRPLLHPAERVWPRITARAEGERRFFPEGESLSLDESSRTVLLQGRSERFLFWDHMSVLERAGDGACVLSEELLFAPARQRALSTALARLYLTGSGTLLAALAARD